MSLAVDAVVVAGGIFLGRLIARVVRRRREGQAIGSGASRSGAAGSRATGSRRDELHDEREGLLDGFACQLGDVILRRIEGDEAWLAGALVLLEERPVAALFVGPEARGERAVLVTGPLPVSLTWLEPVAPSSSRTMGASPGGEPPRAVEHAGARFQRTRRLPVRVQRIGEGAPQVGARAVLGEYTGEGSARLVLVVGTEAALAWQGVALFDGEYDVLPGGESTLEA